MPSDPALLIIKTSCVISICSLVIWHLICLGFHSNESNYFASIHRQLNSSHSDQLPRREITHNLWKLSKTLDNHSGEDIQDALPINCFLHSYRDISSTDTQAAIVINNVDRFVAIVFRSTENDDFNDWKTNLSSKPVSPEQLPGAGQGVKLHEGFQKAVITNNLAQYLANDLNYILSEDTLAMSKVYVTGFSLGGKSNFNRCTSPATVSNL